MPASRRRQPLGWSFPIGKIAGIRVSVHLSFLVLVALVVIADAQPGGMGIGDGLIWLAAIFACVVVHELAHSLVARSKGAVVHAIVLLPIGGVSQIEKIPEFWQDELAVAAAGPLASLGLAVLAGSGSILTGGHLLPVNLYGGGLLARLAWINLLLGGFNLLPAFPLDGGRVLRAMLERQHDVVSATRRAAQLGRALGAVMVVVGLYWDLWLVVIGVFVYVAATQEERSVLVHRRLRDWEVGQFMRSPVTTVDARQPAQVLSRWRTGPQVVTLDGSYYGMVDYATVHLAGGSQTVADVTDREAPTLEPHEDLGRSALDRLLGSGYRVLAVVDGTQVVGVLVADDLGTWLDAAA